MRYPGLCFFCSGFTAQSVSYHSHWLGFPFFVSSSRTENYYQPKLEEKVQPLGFYLGYVNSVLQQHRRLDTSVSIMLREWDRSLVLDSSFDFSFNFELDGYQDLALFPEIETDSTPEDDAEDLEPEEVASDDLRENLLLDVRVRLRALLPKLQFYLLNPLFINTVTAILGPYDNVYEKQGKDIFRDLLNFSLVDLISLYSDALRYVFWYRYHNFSTSRYQQLFNFLLCYLQLLEIYIDRWLILYSSNFNSSSPDFPNYIISHWFQSFSFWITRWLRSLQSVFAKFTLRGLFLTRETFLKTSDLIDFSVIRHSSTCPNWIPYCLLRKF